MNVRQRNGMNRESWKSSPDWGKGRLNRYNPAFRNEKNMAE
jgi:hypothetical protein